jgi:hypothetical protein
MPRASSKRGRTGRSLAVAFAIALATGLSGPALADPAPFLPVEAREIAPPRPLGALVPQARIASSIELGRIAFPSGGGGALGSIIIAGNNDIPQRLADAASARGEEWIAPLVAALSGFDAASLAGEATSAALAGTPWLAAGSAEVLAGSVGQVAEDGTAVPVNVTTTYAIGLFGPEANVTSTAQTWVEELAAVQRRFEQAYPDAAERAQVLWRYQMSSDFVSVQVIADVSITRRGAVEPHYAQQVISVVRLNRPSFVEEENVARWAVNDAAPARDALTRAFARVGEVLPHVLALDEAGFTAATDRRRESATAAGYHGPVLLRDATGPVFWAKDGDQRLAAFVTVQAAAE